MENDVLPNGSVNNRNAVRNRKSHRGPSTVTVIDTWSFVTGINNCADDNKKLNNYDAVIPTRIPNARSIWMRS